MAGTKGQDVERQGREIRGISLPQGSTRRPERCLTHCGHHLRDFLRTAYRHERQDHMGSDLARPRQQREQGKEEETQFLLEYLHHHCSDSILQSIITETEATLYLRTKKYDTLLLTLNNNPNNSTSYSLLKAQAYENSGKWDSALYYARKVMSIPYATAQEKLYELLEKNKLEKNVYFDFSVLSFGNYYTGITLQGYTKGVGEPILEGGRYDNLISSFGDAKDACGFAINVNGLINKTKLTYERDITYVYSSNKEKLYDNLKDGYFASLDETLEDAFKYAAYNNIKKVIDLDNNKKYVLKEGEYVCQE